MASHLDLARLAAQGRAYDTTRAWTDEELSASQLLISKRSLTRLEAADFVRNGIMSVEDFDKAQAAKFTPKTLDEAHADTEVALKENGKAAIKKSKKV